MKALNMPTVTEPAVVTAAEAPVREQIQRNQETADAQWFDTERDMAIGQIIRSHDEIRRTRAETLTVAALALVLFVVGLVWTAQTLRHDLFVQAQREAAERSPYVPEYIGRG